MARGEGIIASFVLLALAQLVLLPLGLWYWGRWVARRRGERHWRHLARAPLLVGALNLAGGLAWVVSLIRNFASVAHADASTKAALLSRDISESMLSWPVFATITVLLYLSCAGVFAYGSLLAPRSSDASGTG